MVPFSPSFPSAKVYRLFLALASNPVSTFSITGLRPQTFQVSTRGVGPRICMSNKFPGDTNAVGPDFENH